MLFHSLFLFYRESADNFFSLVILFMMCCCVVVMAHVKNDLLMFLRGLTALLSSWWLQNEMHFKVLCCTFCFIEINLYTVLSLDVLWSDLYLIRQWRTRTRTRTHSSVLWRCVSLCWSLWCVISQDQSVSFWSLCDWWKETRENPEDVMNFIKETMTMKYLEKSKSYCFLYINH